MTNEVKFKEREDKWNFPGLASWSPDLIAAIREDFEPHAVSTISRRSYRSYRIDTLDNDLHNINIDLRRRGTLIIPDGKLMAHVDPRERKLDEKSVQFCLKTSDDLQNREEYEVNAHSKGSKCRRRLDRQSGGKLREAFNKAGIAPADLMPRATYDVDRLYFENSFHVSPEGEVMKDATAHTAQIIVSMCMDSGEVLHQVNGLLMVIGHMSTQNEREIKRKHCPFEGTSPFLTSLDATDLQIQAAMDFTHAKLANCMPNEYWVNAVMANMSKAAEAELVTQCFERGMTSYDVPRLRMAA